MTESVFSSPNPSSAKALFQPMDALASDSAIAYESALPDFSYKPYPFHTNYFQPGCLPQTPPDQEYMEPHEFSLPHFEPRHHSAFIDLCKKTFDESQEATAFISTPVLEPCEPCGDGGRDRVFVHSHTLSATSYERSDLFEYESPSIEPSEKSDKYEKPPAPAFDLPDNYDSLQEQIHQMQLQSYDRHFAAPPYDRPFEDTFSEGCASEPPARLVAPEPYGPPPHFRALARPSSAGPGPTSHPAPRASGLAPPHAPPHTHPHSAGPRPAPFALGGQARADVEPAPRADLDMPVRAAPPSPAPKPKPQKKHTRKHTVARSRKGCWICRIKHLKCDEVHPVCSNCTRFGIGCDYSKQRPDYVSDKELRRKKLDSITKKKRRRSPDY